MFTVHSVCPSRRPARETWHHHRHQYCPPTVLKRALTDRRRPHNLLVGSVAVQPAALSRTSFCTPSPLKDSWSVYEPRIISIRQRAPSIRRCAAVARWRRTFWAGWPTDGHPRPVYKAQEMKPDERHRAADWWTTSGDVSGCESRSRSTLCNDHLRSPENRTPPWLTDDTLSIEQSTMIVLLTYRYRHLFLYRSAMVLVSACLTIHSFSSRLSYFYMYTFILCVVFPATGK